LFSKANAYELLDSFCPREFEKGRLS